MLYYNRIDVSKRTDINKTSTSKQVHLSHCWYFLDKQFKFQWYIFNVCHDVLMISINFIDIAILNINSADYRCIIDGISKSDALN